MYSLTTFAGSKATEALFKKCFFQFWIVFGVTSYFFDNCDIVTSDSSNSNTTFVLYSALKFFIYLFVIYLNSFSFDFISSPKQNYSFCCLILSVHYNGSLKSLKTAIHEYTQVHDEYCEISFLHDQYIDLKNNLEYAQKRRDDILFDLDQNIKKQNLVVSSFSNKILELHHVLYGNKAASFAIEVKKPYAKKRKHFVFLHMEIDDSGSARSTHEKMLIFDFSLLFCPDTKKNHINMLIHDGAFEGINDDTKFQLFNWLHTHQENEECFQYIATINHDSFEALEEKQKFTFDLKSYVVAQYTKNNRLFRKKYAEK